MLINLARRPLQTVRILTDLRSNVLAAVRLITTIYNKPRSQFSTAYGVTLAPKLEVVSEIKDEKVTVELGTATAANFRSSQERQHLGKPPLCKTSFKFQSASKHELPVRGSFEATTSCRNWTTNLVFMVTEVPGLNLLGRGVIAALDITVDDFFPEI